MPLKIIDYGTKEYKQVLDLRLQILRKPLGLEFSKEEIEKEANDIHIAAYEDDEILGCCMLTQENPTTVRLRQMAVKPGLQHKGIGKVLMQFAENIARDRGNKLMTMHARKTAVGFYEKQGYSTTGKEFMEVTIPHIVMTKDL